MESIKINEFKNQVITELLTCEEDLTHNNLNYIYDTAEDLGITDWLQIEYPDIFA